MNHYITDETVEMHKVSLKDSYPLPLKKIALMHIDSPKKYSDFKYILFRFFPLLRKGSVIIFQDFFYHWSGTLISAIQILFEMGIIKMSFTAACSLIVIVLDEPDAAKIEELDQRMACEDLPTIIDKAIEATNNIEVDRRDYFQPRLHLAKIQLLAERGEFEKASIVFNNLLKNNKFNSVLLYNFSEMLGQNFKLI